MRQLTEEQRSRIMSHIRSKDTSIEVSLRKALWSKGFRYRKNFSKLPGKPDIVISKHKVAIFCDSDFFHGRDWETKLLPRIRSGKNPEYWEKKIQRNMLRDRTNNELLTSMGWTVIRFWGSDIAKDLDHCIEIIENAVSARKEML